MKVKYIWILLIALLPRLASLQSEILKVGGDNLEQGLYVSNNFGKTWKAAENNLSPDLLINQLGDINGKLVLASDNKGVLIGDVDHHAFNGNGFYLPSKSIIAVHALNGVIYVGLSGGGLFSSGDGGNFWIPINLNIKNFQVQCITHFNGRLYVGGNKGIFYFNEKDKKWKQQLDGSQVYSFAQNGKKFLAATDQGIMECPSSKEKEWTTVQEINRAVKILYVGQQWYSISNEGRVFVSYDEGSKWSKVSFSKNPNVRAFDILFLNEQLVLSTSIGMFLSADNGKTWMLGTETDGLLLRDIHAIGNTLFALASPFDGC